MKKTIAVLKGDGIGPEVMKEALKILHAIESRFGHEFSYKEGLIGGAAYEEYEQHFPKETQEICEEADAILFGSVGGPVSKLDQPKWKNCEKESLLGLRQAFQFFCNLRPITVSQSLKSLSPLKFTETSQFIDILCVRELLGDVYFGQHETYMDYATDVMFYDRESIVRIAEKAFEYARKRSKKVTSVDKANILDTSRFWRKVVEEVASNYSDCILEHILVDNCAMQLVRNPAQFDVLLMPNLFGDILSDEASMLVGSLGLIPSASLNQEGKGLYEPMGGSAQDIAGKNIANPIAQILSAALLLRHSFGLETEAHCIEESVKVVLSQGYGTADLNPKKCVNTEEIGSLIREHIIVGSL